MAATSGLEHRTGTHERENKAPRRPVPVGVWKRDDTIDMKDGIVVEGVTGRWTQLSHHVASEGFDDREKEYKEAQKQKAHSADV